MGGIEVVSRLPQTLLDIMSRATESNVEKDLLLRGGEEGDPLLAPSLGFMAIRWHHTWTAKLEYSHPGKLRRDFISLPAIYWIPFMASDYILRHNTVRD